MAGGIGPGKCRDKPRVSHKEKYYYFPTLQRGNGEWWRMKGVLGVKRKGGIFNVLAEW